MTRYNPKIEEGLNDEQVASRHKSGDINYNTTVKTKTLGEIIFFNLFTLFNMINLGLGICIFLVRSYKNLLFLGVVTCNTLISIIQEIRSKRAIDKLSIINSPVANVVRNGQMKQITVEEVVLDDIIKYKRGNQVVADSIILDGTIEVNESLLTGEENSIVKYKGEILYSGSFIVSGNAICKVEKVGKDKYASKITDEAKYVKRVNSQILKTFKKIIKVLSIVIIPIGIILFFKQYSLADTTMQDAVVNTVAAMVGMIPEGLILLTSTVLAVSVIRLSRKNVLVQQLYCIETLARVDTICLDKTGTLTEGTMILEDVIRLSNHYDVENILCAYAREMSDDSPTMAAISRKYNRNVGYTVLEKETFSSEKKYSSVTFKEGKYIMGAPELLDRSKEMQEVLEKYSDYRTVLLRNEKENIALILLKDKIRFKAFQTLNYLRKQDVDIKIISGDSEKVISMIARRLKFEEIKCIDMSMVKSKSYEKIVDEYNIFCRVTPQQKRELIRAMKKKGHTVAMTGDGVNDVLSLKESDCSIAMASGSDAARNVSELVLLDSNFDAIPKIVGEGRRTINNIERSASLFLTKTTYSTLLALLFLFISMNYPFQPIQLSLVSTLNVGFPAFILALEPNKERVKGNFFLNILKKSLPGGITIVLNIIIVMVLATTFNIDNDQISTTCVLLVSMTGFILLFKICGKFNFLRKVMFASLLIAYIALSFGLAEIFEFVLLKPILVLYLFLLFLVDIGLFTILSDTIEKLVDRYQDKIIK